MGTSMRFKNQRGFSLIEILMVLVLIAVLAAIAINSFVNFKTEAADGALRADLKVIRTGIAVQYAQMQLRCSGVAGTFPPFANVLANDITSGGAPCTTVQVAIASERTFVQGAFPVSPIGTLATVINCSGAATGCTRGNNTSCTAGAVGGFTNNWCYNPANGEFWVDDDPAAGVNYEAY